MNNLLCIFPQNKNDRTRLFWDSFSWWASKHEFYDQIGISTTAVLSLPPDGRKREREFRAALDFEGSEAERARERETLWKEAKAILQQSAASSTHVYTKQISLSATEGLEWVCIHNAWLFQNHGELHCYQQLNQHPFQHHGQRLCYNCCNPIMTFTPRCI